MPSYFSNNLNLDRSKKFQNTIDNPHIVDWYFSYRLNQFLKFFFDDILDCEWRWHRYECQSRTTIHAHGKARLKNDPGLIKLAAKVNIGRLSTNKLEKVNLDETGLIEALKVKIIAGLEAEERIINYTETLITCSNIRITEQPNSVPDPHLYSMPFDSNDEDKDYESLSNCCQRHVCRIDGYCKSNKQSLAGKCRFSYPQKLRNKTEIFFTENDKSVRAEILCKRNDTQMNSHNRLICQHWRANVDMQIILDIFAAIN